MLPSSYEDARTLINLSFHFPDKSKLCQPGNMSLALIPKKIMSIERWQNDIVWFVGTVIGKTNGENFMCI